MGAENTLEVGTLWFWFLQAGDLRSEGLREIVPLKVSLDLTTIGATVWIVKMALLTVRYRRTCKGRWQLFRSDSPRSLSFFQTGP
jgi:hypothetical protein